MTPTPLWRSAVDLEREWGDKRQIVKVEAGKIRVEKVKAEEKIRRCDCLGGI